MDGASLSHLDLAATFAIMGSHRAMTKPRKRRSRLYRIYRYAYLTFVRKNDSPERLGRGAGLGVFIGVVPTFYFGPIIAVAVAGPLGANRAAALAGMIVTGPVMALIWTLCVLVGNALVSPHRRIGQALIERHDTAAILANFLGTFLLGNMIVAASLALAGYGLVWWMAASYHSRKRQAREPLTQPLDAD